MITFLGGGVAVYLIWKQLYLRLKKKNFTQQRQGTQPTKFSGMKERGRDRELQIHKNKSYVPFSALTLRCAKTKVTVKNCGTSTPPLFGRRSHAPTVVGQLATPTGDVGET